MKRSKEVLSEIMRTTQMGQVGLQCALNVPISQSLQAALRTQLQEYGKIEQEARSIASSRGWTLDELEPALVSVTKIISKIRFACGDADYKVTATTIEGNTKGMIKCLHSLRQFNQSDERISVLSQKLLDCEKANIRQMQGFL